MAKKKSSPAKKVPGKKAGKKDKKHRYSWLIALLVAIAIAAVVRLFVFQSYLVQTSSMSNTLLPGDWLVIDKVSYGARTPITAFSIPFSPVRYESSAPKLYLDWLHLPYFRLPGVSKIRHNDVIAFNYPADKDAPIDKKIMLVKRCVALPGDTLKIRKNLLFVNEKKVSIKNVQYEYRVEVKTQYAISQLADKYQLTEGGVLSKFDEYTMYLTDTMAKTLKTEPSVRSVTKEAPLDYGERNMIFPNSDLVNWKLDNYGPIIVPKRGRSVEINRTNIDIYREVIETYEGNIIEIMGDKILINHLPLQQYFFKYNYYFVLDDNRDNSRDSRLWGFLPEQYIVGKVQRTIVSFNPAAKGVGKIRWNRFFKKVI